MNTAPTDYRVVRELCGPPINQSKHIFIASCVASKSESHGGED